MTATDIQLIETIRVQPGRHVPLLAGHQKRLEASCEALGYSWPGAALHAALHLHVSQLDVNNSYRLRLLLGADGRYSLESNPLAPTPEPVRLSLRSVPLQAESFWLQHKTTRRPWYADAQNWLEENPEFFDVVYCNDKDEVCEGSRSNVYIRNDDGAWLTPPISCGLLPGVQRQALLDEGLVREAVLSRSDFQNAPVLRVSNALRGWLDATL